MAHVCSFVGALTVASGSIDCTQGHSVDNPNLGILSCDYPDEILHHWFDNDRCVFTRINAVVLMNFYRVPCGINPGASFIRGC